MTLNGALRKSSRLLSHLLMSSCPILSALLLGSSSSGRHQTLRRMVQIRNGIAELLHRAPPILTADTLNVICDFLNQYIQFYGCFMQETLWLFVANLPGYTFTNYYRGLSKCDKAVGKTT